MKKSILITGVSGVGKTSLSNKLNELGYKSYDIDDVPGLFTMIHRDTKLPIKDHDNFDLEKVKIMTWVCDIPKLRSIMDEEENNLAFYCGNGSNIYQFMELFDKVILLTANIETTKYRLSTRTNNNFAKTEEIQEYILDEKDKWENEIIKKGGVAVDTHKDLSVIAQEVLEIAKKN